MASRSRPNYTRQRSNSVPTLSTPGLSFANVTAEEAGILFSAAERATARRKRPVSVDSPGPIVNLDRSYDQQSIPARKFNFSTPSRLGFGKSPLRTVQRTSSVKSLPRLPSPSPYNDDDITPPTSARSTASSLMSDDTITSPHMSPRRLVENPVLKSYADGLFAFTQSRLNTAAPETLKTLGLRQHRSRPSTPELDADELPRRSQRPVFRSQFSDWSSAASSGFGPSSPPSPSEPGTPNDFNGLMTPDSFFAEETPRAAQIAQWTATISGRPSSGIVGNSFFLDSPARPLPRQSADSISTQDAFSYFAGFDGATNAAMTRLSNDHSVMENSRLSGQFNRNQLRSQPSSIASNLTPFTHVQAAQSPYRDMMALSRTPSWQVRVG